MTVGNASDSFYNDFVSSDIKPRALQIVTVNKVPWPVLSVVACAILATYPVWRWGLTTHGDAIFHTMWYTNFTRQFLSGDLYPRWLLNMNAGLGSPVLFYYAPLPYYLTLLFKPFAHGDRFGLAQLGWSAALSLVVSGLTCFAWLERVTSRRAAAIAAMLYVITPYHLNIDLYSRSALAELWAFAFLPLILYFVARAVDCKYAAVGTALSYAALIVTHLPSVVIFSFVPPLYALVRAETHNRLRYVTITVGGLVIGAGLSAIYLLPAVFTQNDISVGDFRAVDYHLRWLHFQPFQLANFESELFWYAILMIALSSAATLMCWSAQRSGAKREVLFAVLLAGVSTFMMFRPSNFLWRMLPTLQTIQFPWRFSSLLCLATSSLIANAIRRFILTRSLVPNFIMLMSVALMLTAATFATFTAWKVSQSTAVSPGPEFVKRFEQMRDAPEYRPAMVQSIQEDQFQEMLGRICKTGDRIAQGCVVDGHGSIAFSTWQARRIEFDSASDTGITVNVSQFFFPAWKAKVDGEAIPIRASASDGLINLALPSGTHHVELILIRRSSELVGVLVSAVFAVVLVCMLVVPRWIVSARSRSIA